MKKINEKCKKLFLLFSLCLTGCQKALMPASQPAKSAETPASPSVSDPSPLVYVKALPEIAEETAPVSEYGTFFASSNEGKVLTYDAQGKAVLPEGYDEIIVSANHANVAGTGYVWADAGQTSAMTYELSDGKILSQTPGTGLGGFNFPIGYDEKTGQIVKGLYDAASGQVLYEPVDPDSLLPETVFSQIYILEGHETGTSAESPADGLFIWNMEADTVEPYAEPEGWQADRGPAVILYMTLNNGLQMQGVYPKEEKGQLYIVDGKKTYGPYISGHETGSGEAVAFDETGAWLLSPGQDPLLLPAGTETASGRIQDSVLIRKDGVWALYHLQS